MHLNPHSIWFFFVSLRKLMAIKHLHIIIILCAVLCVKCSDNGAASLHGYLNGEISQITLFKESVHYKYGLHFEEILKVDEYSEFSFDLQIDEPDVYFLRLFNHDYPIYVEPGKKTTVIINTNTFPIGTTAKGPGKDYNIAYQEYLARMMKLEQHARSERRSFLKKESNDYLTLQKLRVQLAKECLAGTAFDFYLYRNIGDLLFAKLEEIRLRKNETGFDSESARQEVLEIALNKDFFSYKSLKSQRAGIRDFADRWASTFGIQTELEEEHDRQLMDYDWKRLGFESITEKKLSLLRYTNSDEARDFAEMYLIAEMLGEGEFETASKHYYDFISRTTDKEYVTFLSKLYADVKRIQPGQKAPNFLLADEDGKFRSLSDFAGKFVLLDFWATWCAPCLNEFSYLEEVYESFKNHDFEIISVSVDEEKNSWLNMIDQYDHQWVQLYAGQGFTHPDFSTYRPGGIPFYVLIDRNGYILRLNDIRPSFNFDEVFSSILYAEKEYALRN